MGMSASQARFLSLTARKTNVEYEGQQINQQRTALSNESSNYYSQLTSLTVPTPPSSSDFTKITYTFENGSELNTVTSLVATKDGSTEGGVTLSGTKDSGIYKLNYVQQIPQDSMVVNGTNIISKSQEPSALPTGSPSSISDISAIKTKSKYWLANANLQIAEGCKDSSGTVISSSVDEYRVKLLLAGVPTDVVENLSVKELEEKMKLEKTYVDLAKQKYGEDTQWHVRYQRNSSTGNYEPVFYNTKDLEDVDYNEKTTMSLNGLRGYVYGPSTETREVKNALARVEQDATGRYIGIVIYPSATDANNNTNGTYYDLTTTTESDDAAYNDAMNQYYYDKAIYDQTVQEINAKIEVIQIQDKNLELKLKQLDTEQNAISTEMDAVKKVISKNVESSFKTFNA